MDIRWHKVGLNCKHCENELTITEMSSSADGEIRLDLVCVKCAKSMYWVTNTARLITMALYSDIEECMAKKSPQNRPNMPVRPPLAEPKPKDDNDFLHDLGIGGL
jgi:hypothetical protein